ncbi:MAG: FAD-dependent monooxygenase [Rhodococcus sp. (in: high G+C Gram-positive bacteria)]|nr:FAD-dependent monooxygenase [Rhodococcus sp. (in: high G+C Gram-positive bacteria)]
MQFHHHGYVSTDPRVQPAAGVGLDRPDELPDEVDVLIVGSGPAGMMTAAQLSMFPNIVTRVIERRDGRLVIGQADGVQARAVETFQAFGFADRITSEAYRITQTCFWKPDPANPENIIRTAVTEDDPNGMSEFPHLIVNQARVLDYFAEFMGNAPARQKVDYGIDFAGLEVTDDADYPVHVRVKYVAGDRSGEERTIRAKFVVGSDGARSRVRDDIGAVHLGAVSYHAWGVMDVLANTDFPDIRSKCAIQSAHGSILHIPREGGYLFRMYVDLGEVSEGDGRKVRETPIEEIIAKANRILNPYSVDVKNVAWFSVYEVGHRVTDRFDDVPEAERGSRQPRVFITGDACHTHSAKAGQGMNVSMQDGFNLAWKLAYVLEGRSPHELLSTFTAERQVIAQNLIDFDREWSSLMAKNPEDFDDPADLEEFYVSTWEFPSGFMTQYPEALLIGGMRDQALAEGFPVGKRFKSAPTWRVSDGNSVHLGHSHAADGRWRIYAFADAAAAGESSAFAEWAQWLATSPDSPVVFATPEGADSDSVFDVKAIYQQHHLDVNVTKAPDVFKPLVGPYGLRDLEKVFASGPEGDIFEERSISREGAVVVVRPDMYVAQVLPFSATAELSDFFKGFMNER